MYNVVLVSRFSASELYPVTWHMYLLYWEILNRNRDRTQRGGIGRRIGGSFKREGTYVHLWLIHVGFERKQQNSVKQLSFNQIKKKIVSLHWLRSKILMFLSFHLSPIMARGNFSLKVWDNQEKSLLCKHLLRLWDQSSESSLPGKLPMQEGHEKGLVHLNYRLLHACFPLDPTPVRFQLSNGRFIFSFPTTSECTPGREFQKCICLRKSILKIFITRKNNYNYVCRWMWTRWTVAIISQYIQIPNHHVVLPETNTILYVNYISISKSKVLSLIILYSFPFFSSSS